MISEKELELITKTLTEAVSDSDKALMNLKSSLAAANAKNERAHWALMGHTMNNLASIYESRNEPAMASRFRDMAERCVQRHENI